MQTVADREVKTATLDVKGMKCAGCVSAVERQLHQNDGVTSARVNLITEVAVVEYRPETVSPDRLAEKLTAIGFPSKPRDSVNLLDSRNAREEERQKERERQVKKLYIAAFLLIFSFIGHLHHIGGLEIPVLNSLGLHWGLATLALLFPGREIFIDGWRGLRHGMPNMNTLVGLGTGSAYLASCLALIFPRWGWECFFDEPVMLLGFILLGRTLEARARSRAEADLEALVALQPPVAYLIGDPSDRVGIAIPVEQVRIGEMARVLPGERVPIDGEIIDGQTSIDESLLTGESLPVVKETGDKVIAGTINLSGAIAVRATRVGQNTTLAKIIASVESAQIRKAPVQKLADTVAGYFAYGVLTIAAAVFLFWYTVGANLFPWVLLQTVHHEGMMVHSSPLLLGLKLAISVLVVACPCALGLATPTAILVGTSLGAERGILIKGGDVLEIAHRLNTIAFDKTGTLTVGHPEITDRLSFSSLSPDEILQLAATVESGTNHPLARAIASIVPVPEFAGEDFQTVPGLGVSARVNGERVLLGNEDWLSKNGVEIAQKAMESLQPLVKGGKTIVYLARGEELAGAIAFQDRLRTDARETVRALRDLGLEVLLLSGDRPEVVGAIARQSGIEHYRAGVCPEEKAKIIGDLQDKEGKIVAMVGDGINDAPALARANIGIALGGGTDVAIETAGIVLTRDRLPDVVESLRLSLATFRKIRQNLFWALGYNTFAIPLAAGVLLPGFGLALGPALSAALMASSSILVVTNSLLLRRHFPRTGQARK
ncbi:heavy metal translocating P-type ATPase [Pannus brasiliensis CCIBt3594]|uniref:Probable copper-transporting ATPase PacS n=1 Tax=Pannus brasiliensis CCIBt3594 TaxID=1427578 RepID=A0AAW9QHW6_9CHRO